MDLAYLRKELKLPLCVLQKTIIASNADDKCWIDCLESPIADYVKHFEKRPLRYKTLGFCCYNESACVVEFSSETKFKPVVELLKDYAEEIAFKTLNKTFCENVEDIEKDLIVMLGENVKLSKFWLLEQSNVSPKNCYYYTPNNRVASFVMLEGGDNLNVSVMAKVIAKNALFYYGEYLQYLARIEYQIVNADEEVLKKRLEEKKIDFVSFLLSKPLLFTEKGIDWRANFQTTIKQYLCNETKLLKCSAPILIKEIKLWGFE